MNKPVTHLRACLARTAFRLSVSKCFGLMASSHDYILLTARPNFGGNV